jgi:signal transduction histidine kinase
MNPLTSVLFFLAAVSLWLISPVEPLSWQRIAGTTLASLVTLLGSWVLVACVAGWDAGVDRLLFADRLGANRMAPNTAFHFVLVGLALLTLDAPARGQRVSQWLAISASIGALMSLVGYAYGARTLYGVANYIPMALNTAILFAVMALGILCSRPDRGVVAILTARQVGGVMARRLLPAAIFIPAGLGFLRVMGQHAGLYDMEFGAALMVVLTVVMLVGAVVITAAALNETDAQRRQAEETVQLYSDVVRQMPIGLTIWRLEDPEDPRSLRFISANPASFDLLGVELTTLINRRILEAFPAVPENHLTIYADVARSGRNCRSLECVYGDDRVATNTWSVRAFPLPDRCVGLAFENISARKAAEARIHKLNEELEQRVAERTTQLAEANRELLQKNRENEMFVYSVSHDLRSPLVSLQGFSKELGLTCADLQSLLSNPTIPEDFQQQATTLLERGVRQSIHFIQSAVVRLGNIIDALLRLSRAGRVEYQQQAVDVARIVSRVVDSTSLAQFDGAVEIKVGELPPCMGDPTALEQVFGNLIGNAIKYRDPERPCEIEIGCAARAEGGAMESLHREVTYYVKDSGLGISEASKEKVFLAFKRAHPTVAEGEGMGLAIVRRIVERHGGSIWVESKVGQGSTFFLSLPSAPALETGAANVSPSIAGVNTHVCGTDGDLARRR